MLVTEAGDALHDDLRGMVRLLLGGLERLKRRLPWAFPEWGSRRQQHARGSSEPREHAAPAEQHTSPESSRSMRLGLQACKRDARRVPQAQRFGVPVDAERVR